MQDINFKITKQDIVEYLSKHKNEEAIKNREAMFVKYMKESNMITQESLEILMRKYNLDNRRIEGTYSIYDGRGYSKQEELSTFTDYLIGIENLDISGICHVMIPILSYYNEREWYQNFRCHQTLFSICKQLNIIASFEVGDDAITDMKENYLLGFGHDYVYREEQDTYFKFSKDKSRKLLERYSQIYGEEPVKQIRRIIREGM